MSAVGQMDSRTVGRRAHLPGPAARPSERPTPVIDVPDYSFWYGASQAPFRRHWLPRSTQGRGSDA